MNATLQFKYAPGQRDGQCRSWAGNHINIVFISHGTLEIPITQPMISRSEQAKSPGAPGKTANGVSLPGGLAATLKHPRVPESRAFADWISAPAPVDSEASDRQERNLFDASLRALARRAPGDAKRPELKLVEFSVAAPAARSVQLAADFTDWKAAPIDLIALEDGSWSAIVPLPPGTYAYRYLVDGEWYDDPLAEKRNPEGGNSFKTYIQIK